MNQVRDVAIDRALEPDAAGAPARMGGSWYVLAVLTAIYTTHSLDRQLISIVFEPLKSAFHLSDTELGVLAGTVYAISFALAGMPLGVLVDRMNRRNLLAAAVALWSAATALSGLASSYAMLMLARIGLAVCEAPSLPSAVSLLSDLFPTQRRATAIGIFAMGLGLGQLLGFGVGGLIAEHWGWQRVFFIGGIPGLVLAFLLLASVREPVRRRADGAIDAAAAAPPLGETARFIVSQPSLLNLYAGHCTLALVASACMAFLPSFFIRMHGLPLGKVGLIVGVGFGISTTLGSLAGGFIVDKLAKRNVLWIPRYSAVCSVLVCIAVAAMALVPSLTIAAGLMMFWSAAFASTIGPNLGLGQSLVGTRMRGTASALLNTLVNLIAYGTGAVLVGFLSDLMARWAGRESLRFALFAVAAIDLFAALMFARIARTLKRDLARCEAI